MTKVAVIIQARLQSSRFPNKILEPLGDTTVLGQVLRRCKAIRNVDVVCCALPSSAEDDAAADEAASHDVVVFRGDGPDVLARYHAAGTALNADIILRVTSDCPLIDPDVSADVVDLLSQTGAAYGCNNMPLAWPHGLDCEAFTYNLLQEAMVKEVEPWLREHVTTWMRTSSGIKRASLPGPGGDTAHLRWTVDYPEDLEFMKALFDRLPDAGFGSGYREILSVIEANPQLADINAKYSEPDRDPDRLASHDLAKIPASSVDASL